MKQINAVVLATILVAYSVSVSADGPAIGPNGGQVRDAGKYHLELIVKDTALSVYVTGNKDAKIATKGATGTATVLAGKGTSNVKLEPSGENALSGRGDFQPAPDMKVVVSVTLPGQLPVQARFTPIEKPKPSAKASKSTAQMSEGEVRKIDKEAGKVTIKHGPLENLGMPAMTMAYRVKDTAMLDQVKIGDKINFVADKVNGAYTVMQLETAK